MPITRVALVIEGDNADVMEVVSLALAGNLIQSMEQRPVENPVRPRKPAKPRLVLSLDDRVVAIQTRPDYGVTRDKRGRVIGEESKHGKGGSVEVQWEDGSITRSPVSVLRKIA